MSGAELDRFYDVPTTVTARLVGGPFDGEERSFPVVLLERQVFPRLVVGLPASLASFDPGEWPPRPRCAEYEALRDADGFVSRDDSGAVRFDFWGLR